MILYQVTVGPLTVVGVIALLYGIEYFLVMCSVFESEPFAAFQCLSTFEAQFFRS